MIGVAKLRVSFHDDLPDQVAAMLDGYPRWRKETWGENHWMYFVPLWVAERIQQIAADHVGAVEA